MKYALKIFSMIILALILIWFALSFVKHEDLSKKIKPITEKILENYKNFKFKNILTKDEIILILNKSGCKQVYVDKSDIVTAGEGTKYEITNHWFHAKCYTAENNLIDISITTNENRFDIRTDIGHTYCFGVLSERVECYTQTLTTIPSR